MSDAIKTQRQGSILEVQLDRNKANAIDPTTSRLMRQKFEAFRFALVQTAGDKFFSAGWDLKARALLRSHLRCLESAGHRSFDDLDEAHD